MANKTSPAGSASHKVVTKADVIAEDRRLRAEWAVAQAQTGKAEHAITRGYGSTRSTDLRVRNEFTREDYEYYRKNESLPLPGHDTIRDCNEAYDDIGVVRQAVDIMSEFGCQGIHLVHKTPKHQRAYQAWAEKVGMPEVSEQFLRHYFLQGITVVHRKVAKIPLGLSKKLEQVWGANVEFVDEIKVAKREVPIDYTFLNPLKLEPIEPELAIAAGVKEFRYAMRLSSSITRGVRRRSEEVMEYLKSFPADIRRRLLKGETKIPLDHDNVRTFRYKPNDWSCWGNPMLKSVIVDCNLLRKMKLADATALDGAMSAIRVWKLGSLEHQMAPAAGQFERLADMLQNTVGGGVLDIIWTADIDLIETKTDLYNFLGEEKYRAPLNQINIGLGIPPSMTGGNGSGGVASNFLNLRTLSERLQYARNALVKFWKKEIRQFQKAMGYREPAYIAFAHTDLTDQNAQNQLMLHLADRDLISIETLQDRLGMIPEVEAIRLRREQRLRKKKKLQPKAGPFHNANPEHDLAKIFSQSGVVTPSEVGLDLLPRKKGEKTGIEMKPTPTGAANGKKPKGQPGQGRPAGKKDSSKRKSKRVVPVRADMGEAIAWAVSEHGKISGFATEAYLKSLGKSSAEELTIEEQSRVNAFSLRVLASLEPGTEVSKEYMRGITGPGSLPKTPPFIESLATALIDSHEKYHTTPLDSRKVLGYQSLAVATHIVSK